MAYDKDFYIKLARDAGLPDEQVATLTQALTNEKFLKPLSDGFLRHDDYSRQADALRTKEQDLTKWYNDTLPMYQKAQAAVARQAELEARLKELGEDTSAPPARTNGGLSKEELAAEFKTREGTYWNVQKDLVSVALSHLKTFGEELDMTALEKYAVENQMPLRAAYQAYVAPKLQERKDAEWAKKVELARAEGAKDALSQAHLPAEGSPAEPHSMTGKREGSLTPTSTDNEKYERWKQVYQEAGSASK